jgi:leader peptidase (prepilin peptidase)/N-methyltransferase
MLISAVLCTVLQHSYGWSPAFVVLVAHSGLLVAIAVIDLEHRLVPNVLVGSGLVMALGFSTLLSAPRLAAALSGAAVGGGAFLLLALVQRGALGAGDVKLAALIGAMTGFPGVIQALTLGILLGGLAAAVLLLTRIRGRKDYIPYAPYLVAGALATLLCGPQIGRWYTRLIALGG